MSNPAGKPPQEKSSMDAEPVEVDIIEPANATIRVSQLVVSIARIGATLLPYDDLPEEYKDYLPGKSGDPSVPDAPVFEIILPGQNGMVNYSGFIDGYFVETQDGYGAVADLVVDGEYKLDIYKNPTGPKIRRGLYYPLFLIQQKQSQAIIEAAEKSEKERAEKFGLLAAQKEEEKKKEAYEKALKEYNEAQAKKVKVATNFRLGELASSEVEMKPAPPSPLTPALPMNVQSQDSLSQLNLLEAADEEEEVPSTGEKGGPAALGTVVGTRTTQQEPSTPIPQVSVPTTETTQQEPPVVQETALPTAELPPPEEDAEAKKKAEKKAEAARKKEEAAKKKAEEEAAAEATSSTGTRRSSRLKSTATGKGRRYTRGKKGQGRRGTYRKFY